MISIGEWRLASAAGMLLALACSEALPPRHLVLVTIDTLRRDHLGSYGHPEPITPNLDALAARGLRLDDALAQSVSTPPSHASMLTGLYPTRHGLRKLRHHRLPAASHTLAEILKERGFSTAAFLGAVPLRRAAGLDQGFDHYDDDFGARGQRRAAATNERVERWLEAWAGGRLFLWVHYFDPHYPYDAPAEATAGHVPGDDAGARPRVPSRNTNPDTARSAAMVGRAPPRSDIELGRARYAEEVRYTDRAVGELLRQLSARGILDEAIVAVVSDHGEGLGEHGYYFGHWDVYDATARIPMLLVHPAGRFADRSLAAPVGTIDLMPTLLAWLGFEPPPDLDGSDLTGALEDEGGPEARALRDRVLYTEQLESFRARAVRGARWALIERPGSPGGELVARGRQPSTHDAAAARRRLSAALALFREPQGPEPEALEIDPAVAEQLRGLGYVE